MDNLTNANVWIFLAFVDVCAASTIDCQTITRKEPIDNDLTIVQLFNEYVYPGRQWHL